MKRKWWILALILIVVAILGVRFVQQRKARAAASNAAGKYSAVGVTRGDLSITIDASGKIMPATSMDLYPSAQGQITAVLVQAGDTVRAGQVLVRLDSTDAQASLRAAEDNLAIAEDRLRAAKQDLAQAPISAQKDLDGRRAALASAKSRLDQLLAGPTDSEAEQANISLSQAQLSYDAAKDEYDRTLRLYEAKAATKQALDSAYNKLQTAQVGLDSAKSKLKQLYIPSNAEDVSAARASLAQAQADVAIAEENLRNANNNDAVTSAQAGVRVVQNNLNQARKNASGMAVTAPFAGLITAVNANLGAYAGTQSPLVSVATPSTLTAQVQVDENDVGRVQVGQEAIVAISALDSEEFKGRVALVGGMGSDQNGVTYYQVEIDIMDASGRIKPGMSADASVIIANQQNVLSIPNGAFETRLGHTVARMYVSKDEVSYRKVTIGLQTDTHTEITSGLSARDRVAVLAAATASSSGSNGTNQGRGGFMGMPGF